jgi:hypothetical protein
MHTTCPRNCHRTVLKFLNVIKFLHPPTFNFLLKHSVYDTGITSIVCGFEKKHFGLFRYVMQ